MHITIFGIGRSGTKAVQIYISYALAARNQKVWIHYEPYFWLDRKTEKICYEGYYHHFNSPHFIPAESKLSPAHRRYLLNLKKHRVDMVTKFIRGNGRIRAINSVLKPDLSIVIVRDIYEVLISIMKIEWDFWSVGMDYVQNWTKLIDEIRNINLVDNLDWYLDRIRDRIDKNAFYWYVMNKYALLHSDKSVIYLTYKNLKNIEALTRMLINPDFNESIGDPKFSGDNMHLDYPLKSPDSSFSLTNAVNGFFHKMNLTPKLKMNLPTQDVGSLAEINKEFRIIEKKARGSTKLDIEKKEIYEMFNSEINALLAEKEWKPE
ncbi:MAG: hypothetical protein DWQ44_08005 [Bacteroidetes bacterium]|nr:MAG: hypothetical protein DWQ33_06790 [Bacteroidota bacterium]REJ99706.1 MAG: hypothetical protein DWQ39_12305 [Bacteroidota bacterium]REK33939.1 MAG: hypothetical protein DWQ44_08005 [Bacteroidota bacterium]REK47705.1 MAG: hypothetical protein DWQ48_12040 [Bacteroidota bacterium]